MTKANFLMSASSFSRHHQGFLADANFRRTGLDDASNPDQASVFSHSRSKYISESWNLIATTKTRTERFDIL